MTQTILIAGASRGIGLEMAKQARARGDKVIAMVRSTQAAQALEGVAEQEDDGDGEQQRKWNTQAHHEPAAKAHRRHYDNHYYSQCGQYVAFEFLYLDRGEFRLVL